MKRAITEESGIHKAWMIEAKDMTPEKLPEFIRKLTKDYQHDYGTICHAVAAAGVAAMNAINRSPAGGITGFQAGCIIWEVVRGWGVFGQGPLRMVEYENMLYPQYEKNFRSISVETWEHLQKKARELIEDANVRAGSDLAVHPEVLEHWKSVAAGKVPFGYLVADI